MLKQCLVVALLLLTLVLGAVAPVLSAGEEAKGKPQAVCPVMGGNINKDVFIDYQGERVYFCCPACIEVFKKEPDKYLQKMKQQGVTPEKSPAGK